ncbi:HNH endonuclease [Streptomyces sp. TLI_185]|uniref:HNH endonuclease n=1 Tax=Streptomyces sp. TLI_185 TaxID=2485151 RepID=UPI000F4FD12D|nr:HNH endonuclease [Streptomyces sp. TLI_185]RPF32866.1 HNH endonuclease [Streptomyces sp. TLI_185]
MRHGHPLNSARRRVRKEQLARRHGPRCTYCRRVFTDLSEATLDHIVPCSLWRSWSVTSLMLACRPCNQAKGDRLPLSLALLLLAWADPTAPVVRPVDWPLLARLAAVHHTALTSVTSHVTPGVTGQTPPVVNRPMNKKERSMADPVESTAHRPVRRPIVRPACLRAPRSARVCTGPTGEAVSA